jgi:large subunit ribosomal protein L17
MRHSRVINHLGRTSSHRKSMLANMATSLILHKRITTTTAKAKALRTYVEPLITKSKEDSTHSRRVVFSYLKDKEAVAELFRDISPKIGERPGGYTRILKIGNRIGDNADMCILELVDYNEAMLGGGEAAKTKTTRRRRATPKKKEGAAAETAAPKAAKAKAVKTEETAKEAEKAQDQAVAEE